MCTFHSVACSFFNEVSEVAAIFFGAFPIALVRNFGALHCWILDRSVFVMRGNSSAGRLSRFVQFIAAYFMSESID